MAAMASSWFSELVLELFQLLGEHFIGGE